jgi:predicted Mrr-cat superfamily restriction endonuclease
MYELNPVTNTHQNHKINSIVQNYEQLNNETQSTLKLMKEHHSDFLVQTQEDHEH